MDLQASLAEISCDQQSTRAFAKYKTQQNKERGMKIQVKNTMVKFSTLRKIVRQSLKSKLGLLVSKQRDESLCNSAKLLPEINEKYIFNWVAT